MGQWVIFLCQNKTAQIYKNVLKCFMLDSFSVHFNIKSSVRNPYIIVVRIFPQTINTTLTESKSV